MNPACEKLYKTVKGYNFVKFIIFFYENTFHSIFPWVENYKNIFFCHTFIPTNNCFHVIKFHSWIGLQFLMDEKKLIWIPFNLKYSFLIGSNIRTHFDKKKINKKRIQNNFGFLSIILILIIYKKINNMWHI